MGRTTKASTPAPYRIGVVSRLTGVSTHTLRIWERRYEVVVPRRTAGGDRRYTDEQVERLRMLRRAVAAGHSIVEASRLPPSRLSQLTGGAETGTAPPPEAPAPERFVERLRHLDVPACERWLDEAVAVTSPRALCIDLLPALLRLVGDEWEAGRLTIAHEHTASALVRTMLGARLGSTGASRWGPVAVVTTLVGERHELGALLAANVLELRGWRALYLGPDLPATEIVACVQRSGAGLVVLSTIVDDGPATARQLRTVMRGIPDGVRLVVGGTAAARHARIVGADQVHPDLAAFDGWLARPVSE